MVKHTQAICPTKYHNLVRIQAEIISDPNYLVRILLER